MNSTSQAAVDRLNQPTGVSWLGMMPSDWRVLRTRYLFREVDERSVTGQETHLSMSQQYGLVPTREIEDWRRQSESHTGGKLCRTDDLVLNRLKAHLGVFARASKDGVVSPDYTVFRPCADVSVRYFQHLFKTPLYVSQFAQRARGIVEGFWRLYTDDFYDTPALVPPRPEQDAIVAFLDRKLEQIDRYLATKRRQIELLEERIEALISRLVSSGGHSENSSRNPPELSPTRAVPTQWKVVKLRRISVSIRDGTHNPPPAVEGMHRLLSVRNIVEGRFILREDDRTMSPDAFCALQKSYDVREGDVVIALVGATTGKSAVVEPMENVTVQRSIGIIRPIARSMDSNFLHLCIQSPFVQHQIREIMNKYAAQPGIYLDDLASLRVPVPQMAEQHHLLETWRNESGSIFGCIQRLRQEMTLMAEYRTALIAEAVTGRLDVRTETGEPRQL